MSAQQRNQRRARLEQLFYLDLTLMAEDYLISLEDHAAAKDWQSAETLKPDIDLIDEILKSADFTTLGWSRGVKQPKRSWAT
jgi:hypothetical protein